VQEFEFRLEDNLFDLHERLLNKIWRPDPYTAFYIRDPKLRHIHKATVRDRVFNQAVFRVVYPIFDHTFIFDSYSSRIGKGTHAGVERLAYFIRKFSKNYHRPLFALKCDVRKFFDTVSHDILFGLIECKVKNENTLNLINLILKSFETIAGTGLPLGNVTIQLFANIYLNELDQFMKHTLRIEGYVRYADDFVMLGDDRKSLFTLIPTIAEYLKTRLQLTLHPNKVSLRSINQGIDFLGYVIFPHHIILRIKTKRRIIKKVKRNNINSYFGMLMHCNGMKIREELLKQII
jgi:retron-type reverse transcriptase